jgi:hypothetical protein
MPDLIWHDVIFWIPAFARMTIFGVFSCQSNKTLSRRVSGIALIDLFLAVGQWPFAGGRLRRTAYAFPDGNPLR